MSDVQTDAASRGFTVRRAILAILALQLGIAAVLAGRDFVSALPSLLAPTRQPALDQPIRPGDQTRRYRPADLPARESAPGDRISIPNPGDMPTRLRFEQLDEATVLMTGQIAAGDAERFADWAPEDLSDMTVRLHSPGGSVADALAIGRALRDGGFSTTMIAGDICLSACPYVFVGGVERDADPSAMIGVHQHYFGENTMLPAFLAVEDVQNGQAEVLRHLVEMGVDPRLMQHSLSTPPDEIYILTEAELQDYSVISVDSEPE